MKNKTERNFKPTQMKFLCTRNFYTDDITIQYTPAEKELVIQVYITHSIHIFLLNLFNRIIEDEKMQKKNSLKYGTEDLQKEIIFIIDGAVRK